jgi:hypothetical protein
LSFVLFFNRVIRWYFVVPSLNCIGCGIVVFDSSFVFCGKRRLLHRVDTLGSSLEHILKLFLDLIVDYRVLFR